MNRIIAIINLIVILIVLSNAQTTIDFVRCIDRPLQDPKGTHRITFGIEGEKRLHYDTLSIKLSGRYSFAVNDFITFCELPWPVIQIRAKSAVENKTIKDGWDAIALSLIAGATSTSIFSQLGTENLNGYPDDYIRILPRIEILSKISILNRIWAQYNMALSTVSDEAVQGYVYPRIGFQLTKSFYCLVGYRGGFFRFKTKVPESSYITYFYRYGYALDYYHSGNAGIYPTKKYSRSSSIPLAIGLDLGKKFSTIISTSIGKSTGTFIPAQIQCNLEW